MLSFLISVAFAAELSKSECKAFTSELKTNYSAEVWALKDLPVNSGMTMMASWISPIAEVSTSGVKIEVTQLVKATYGSAQAVWYGVRPNELLSFKEAECNDDGVVLTLVGKGKSKGRDTKIKITDGKTLAEIKTNLDLLVVTTNPVDSSWNEDVKTAISNRKLINGMTKKQAYLVVGEPVGSSTKEEGGKKIEIWTPRQTDGFRIGYSMSADVTGYPSEIRFEDGVLVGMASGTGGGVSLE